MEALIHPSFVTAHRTLRFQHNRSLERIGDGLLALIVPEEQHRLRGERWLSGARANRENNLVTSNQTLAEIGETWQLSRWLLTDPNLAAYPLPHLWQADTLEAIIGAARWDDVHGGPEQRSTAEVFVRRLVLPYLTGDRKVPPYNAVDYLVNQVWDERHIVVSAPVVQSLSDGQWRVSITWGDRQFRSGSGATQDEAHQHALRAVLDHVSAT